MRSLTLLPALVLLLGLIAACQRSAVPTPPPGSAMPTSETPSGTHGVKPEPQGPAVAVKLHVLEDGIYELHQADLEAAVLGWGDFDPTRLQLLYRGHEQPLWVEGQGHDLTLRFYGRASESRYSAENVYWLQLSSGSGLRMAERRVTAAKGVEVNAVQSYTATVRAEENRLYSPLVAEGDHWFWALLAAPVSQTFTVTLSALAPGPGRLRVEAWASTTGPPDPDHHLRLYFNGQPVADETWDGMVRHTLEAALSPALLSEGPNIVTLEAPGDTGVDADKVSLDWIEVSYPRRFVAVADRLSFESSGGLHRLTGFSPTAALSSAVSGRPSVVVFDVTHPDESVLVADVVQEPSGEGTTVAFWGEPGHRYLAVGPTGFQRPTRITRVSAGPDLRAPENQADYVAIAHPDLMDALQPLLRWREAQGLKVVAVPVEAVYDQFNCGLPEPEAIRAFLRHAVESWQKPAPQYVLLVGDATYDPRGYLAPPGANLVPTFLVPTVFGGETASDTALVRLDDDPWPDMAIGRVPARTPQQVQTWVTKTLAYERSAAQGPWQRRVIMVADGQDELFRSQSQDLVAHLPPEYEVIEFYPEPGAPDANQQLKQLMNQGSLLVNYIGHGSIDKWGQDLIFTTDDVGALSNGNRLPVVLNMTCLTGLFTHPRLDSMAEVLLWAEGGGAVAVLAPTSLTLPGDQSFFNQALFQALLHERIPILGPAIVQAKRQTPADSAESRDVVETFTLFGDPALRLALPTQ